MVPINRTISADEAEAAIPQNGKWQCQGCEQSGTKLGGVPSRNGLGAATHKRIQIFLPAFPHCAETAIHAHPDDSLASAEPDAIARSFYALRQRYVFQNVSRRRWRGRPRLDKRLCRISRNWPFAAAAGFAGSFTSSNENLFARRQYTYGIRDFSYHVSITCSGENETIAAFSLAAIARARAAESFSCTASASVNKSQSLFASRAPSQTALFFPTQPAGSSFVSSRRNLGMDRARLLDDGRGRIRGLVVDHQDFADFRLRRERINTRSNYGFFVPRGDNCASPGPCFGWERS